jgi:hypothetical protein
MKTVKLFKHYNCNDVAIEILKKFYVHEKNGYKLKIRWWNVVNPDNSWDMGCQENLFISQDDLKNWLELTVKQQEKASDGASEKRVA